MKRAAGNRGSVLVELMMAGFIIALGVAGLAASLLQGPGQTMRSDERERAAECLNAVLQSLKIYQGVNVGGGPNFLLGNWSLPGDGAGGWALANGVHTVDEGSLATWYCVPPAGAAVNYTVDRVTLNGVDVTRVVSNIQYPGMSP